MRLRNLQDENESRQRKYAQTILAIREGRDDDDYAPVLQTDENNDGQIIYALPLLSHFLGDEEGIKNAILFIFPSGFIPKSMYKRTILATTNEKVDEWNKAIQELNPN